MTEDSKIIVTIAERPDLATTVAQWLWETFWRQDGYTLEKTRQEIAQAISQSGPPQTFVLLVNGTPVGTASLDAEDLDEQPDLTPWLANVFIAPKARGHGYVVHLISAVEAACRRASISTLWLYTHTAERIYSKAGWRTVEYFDRRGQKTALMRRDL